MDTIRPSLPHDMAVSELVDARLWRSRLLDVLLRMVFLVGIVVAVPSMAYSATIGEWSVLVVDGVALVVAGVLAFATKLGYDARSIGFLVLAYVLGVFLFVVVGPVAGMYLIAVPVLTAILRGTRASVVALVVTGLTMVAFGFVPGLEPAVGDETIDNIGSWLTVTLNFMFVNAMITLSCGALLTRLESSLTISRRLAIAVEQSPNGIVIAEPDGTVAYANDNTLAYLEATGAEERPATLPELVRGAHPALPGEIPDTGWDATRTIDRSGGADRTTFALELRPTRDESGRRSQLVLIIRDITDERALQDQLSRSEKLQALGTLVGGTAHDFNNALTSIVGLAEHLRSDLRDPDHVVHVDDVLLATERASGIVRQLMAFGKQGSSAAPATDLVDTLTRALPLFRASVPAHLQLSLDAEPGVVAAIEPVEVHQAVANLVTNAAHAMAGDETGTITIRLRTLTESSPLRGETDRPVSCALLSVSDTGHGIEPAVMDRIFEPFFTTKSAEDGTGLGLASVHGAVSGLSGQIEVESEVGTGTTVSLYLPAPGAAPVAHQAPPDPSAEPRTPGPLPAGQEGARVLVVDDEPAIVTSIDRLLRRRGFRVTAIGDAHLALQLLADPAEPFDLVVSDVSMTAMSGIELVRRMREMHSDVPVVLMSGYGEAVLPEVREELGVGAILDKPFTTEQLVARVGDALGQA
ncbi:MAG: hybrid sensor histidine kinase/response regulator [Acidimicrobiales bacterium]